MKEMSPPPQHALVRRLWDRLLATPWLPVFAALLVMIAAFGIANPNFLSVRNFLNIGADMSGIGIMALAATLVLITGGLDLSVGGVLAFSAICGALVMKSGGDYAIILGILTCLLVGTLAGLLNGVLTVKGKLPPFVVTLATLGITVGLGYQLSHGTGVAGLPRSLSTHFGFVDVFGIPAPILLWIFLAIIGMIVLSSTRFGAHSYAVGSSVSATERGGINVGRHLVIVYAISGLMSAVAGVIDIARFSTAAVAAHQTDILAVITAVVIGGTPLFGGVGRIGGTLVGVAILGVLTNGLIMIGMKPYMQQVATGIFLLATLLANRFRETKRSTHRPNQGHPSKRRPRK